MKHSFFRLAHDTHTRADKAQYVLMWLMQFGFAGAVVLSVYEQAWLTLFVSIVGLATVWMLPLMARNFSIHVPLEFEFILNIFIYGSLYLGEIQGYYTRFWWWDIVLHAGSGLTLGFIGFLILYSLHKEGRFKASPFIIAVFSFCFALALGALWEIFEFTVDSVLGFNMQKSGLVDTMWDLIVDAVSALVASVSGYMYMKYHTSGIGFFRYFLNLYFSK